MDHTKSDKPFHKCRHFFGSHLVSAAKHEREHAEEEREQKPFNMMKKMTKDKKKIPQGANKVEGESVCAKKDAILVLSIELIFWCHPFCRELMSQREADLDTFTVCPASSPSCRATVAALPPKCSSTTLVTRCVVRNKSDTSAAVKSAKRSAGRMEEINTSGA